MRATLATTVAVLLCSGALAQQPAGNVFQIGGFDKSYRDLAFPSTGEYSQKFPKDINFAVGQGKPATDFSGIHPGPTDAWAGHREHPFTIRFEMPQPAGAYELRIDLVDTHGTAPPVLRVDINGSSAEQPLEAGAGDLSLVRPESGKARSLRYVLGAGRFKAGANTITLTALRGSWLLYDAISLRKLAEGEVPRLEVTVSPTMFYVNTPEGLAQEFEVAASGVLEDEAGKGEVRSAADLLGSGALAKASLGRVHGPVQAGEAPQARQLTFTVIAGKQTRTVSVTQQPQKKWTIFVAPATHTDIGYTDQQDRVIAVHNRNTDIALDLIDNFPLYHWNLESSWAMEMWLRDRPEYRHDQLLKAAAEGRMGVEAWYLNMLSGLCSEEELIRTMYYTARAEREHQVPFKSCTITDAPSHVWSLPSILAGAGIRCVSVGVNQTRAPLFKKDVHLKSPFWWEGPDGAKVLTWFSNGYSQAGMIGLADDFERMRGAMINTLRWWDQRKDYPYDAILLHGAYSDNVAINQQMATNITEYAKKYAYPKVVLCSNDMFFAHIEKNYADKIPTVRGCGGSWWEDGAGSTAWETAVNRNAHQTIIAAEAALAAAGAAQADTSAELDKAWSDILLYDEHTWGAHNSIAAPNIDFVTRQWAVKARYATDAADRAGRLLQRGLLGLAGKVSPAGDAVLVFNPSGRARSGIVQAEVPVSMNVADGQNVLVQQVVSSDLRRPNTVAFYAKDVPAVGYRVYKLVPAVKEELQARFNGKVLENESFKVTFDPATGGVAGLFDKRLNRELVDQASKYKLGQLIYAAGGGLDNNVTQVECPDPNKVKFSSPTKSRLERGATGRLFSSVRSIFPMPMFPHAELEVILYEVEPRVDFVLRLNKERTEIKEAVYAAFPFAGANPKFRYEIGGASVRPNEDQFPGACRDWFSVQRWVTMNADDGGVAWSPVDSPLITLCQMTPGNWLDELPITNGTVFAYLMNNYWITNYKAAQDGQFEFRFGLTSGKAIDPASASLFGEDVQAPMRAILMPPPSADAKGKLPPTGSFCEVTPANVVLTAFKTADDGDGYIIRVRETGGAAAKARIKVNLPGTTRLVACDLVERNGKQLGTGGTVELELKPFGMATIRAAAAAK